MRRRDFIKAFSSVATALPFAAYAQQADGKRRIGALIITAEGTEESRRRVAAFQEGLEKLGWEVNRNLEIDYRWNVAEPERARAAVAELLALKPDLILANSVVAARAAQQATHTVPIVFNAVSEPISLGLVASLAHPGGNITGFTNFEPGVGGKWLELLKEMDPCIMRVAIMFDPDATPIAPQFVASVMAAAKNFAVETMQTGVRDASAIESAITELGREPGAALITLPDTFLSLHFKQIVDFETRYQIPAIHPFRYFVDAGSLASYGPDLIYQFRQSATYVDRIFRGEKASDLPVQQPSKFEFIINVKTAKTLGLAIPAGVLAIADEVIE